jgi:hypothetical protein
MKDRPQLKIRDCDNCDKTIRSSDEKPKWRDLNGKTVCPKAEAPLGGHKPKAK